MNKKKLIICNNDGKRVLLSSIVNDESIEEEFK
jgi:hypothetical protein